MFKAVDEVFPVSICEAIKNAAGEVTKIEVIEDKDVPLNLKEFIVPNNSKYVFPEEELMSVLFGLDSRFNKPILIWGYHGSGKSTLAEQACSYTNRPSIRVQHSVNTEDSDITGQWILKGGETVFQYGPLARAMRDGLVYIADEYDFALPNVLAIYQAVLEGGALFIKNAPDDLAIVKPHPNFRFVATGNTNGAGDEIGIYQGTQIQNAANYSRFAITVKLDYQKEETEKKIITENVRGLPADHATMLLSFATKIRENFANKEMSNTLSTRELITIARIATLRGKKEGINWNYGISVGFLNRLGEIDRKVADQTMKRCFGSAA